MNRRLVKIIKNPLELTRRLIYVLAGLVAVLSVLVVILAFLRPTNIFVEKEKPTPSFDLSDSEAALSATIDYGAHYIDSTVFLGDYTTRQMLKVKVLDGGALSPQVWSGEDGDLPLDSNISNASIYIPSTKDCRDLSLLLEERRPERIVITLGLSNGVPYCDHDKFVSYYQSLIDVVKASSPDTIIILQSIFPITKKAEKANPALSNDRINRANEWVSELAVKNDVHFLYTAAALRDEYGYLRADYAYDDGINLNKAGFRAVLKYVRTHGTYEQ